MNDVTVAFPVLTTSRLEERSLQGQFQPRWSSPEFRVPKFCKLAKLIQVAVFKSSAAKAHQVQEDGSRNSSQQCGLLQMEESIQKASGTALIGHQVKALGSGEQKLATGQPWPTVMATAFFYVQMPQVTLNSAGEQSDVNHRRSRRSRRSTPGHIGRVGISQCNRTCQLLS